MFWIAQGDTAGLLASRVNGKVMCGFHAQGCMKFHRACIG